MTDFIQIITTFPNKSLARQVGAKLVELKLVACFQIIGPVESLYTWKGKREDTEEYICFLKTKKELYDKIEKEIKDRHPHKVPEIISLPIMEGSKEYLNWINEVTGA